MENWLLRAETICMECGGHCCDEVHPPVSAAFYERLTTAGVSQDVFETVGYRPLKTRKNGECVLSKNGKCGIHAFKPETCRSGPFTFDMNGDMIALYLKHERICPIVGLLKEVPDAYR
ncbi:MAG: YkgJ family cysteine cluster protein [Methanoregula sp.]|jgi:hypothetical protein